MVALLLALWVLNGDETMELKPGVQLADGIWEGAIIIEKALKLVAPDVDCVITSRFDGTHMDGSLHYRGLALDFRTRDLTIDEQVEWRRLCKQMLPKHWQVFLEKDHMHAEFDLK